MTRVLVIHGHPIADSFGEALADAYARGASDAGHEVRELKLRELSFDPILRDLRSREADLEPDLLRAREDIEWAQHIVVEYPTWWSSSPALLKGFVDRAFTPGWAYQYRKDSSGWDKLLTGRSARLIVTMDAPRLWDTLGYFAGSRRSVSKGVFWFCGLKPVRTTCLSNVRKSSDAKRVKQLKKVASLGAKAR